MRRYILLQRVLELFCRLGTEYIPCCRAQCRCKDLSKSQVISNGIADLKSHLIGRDFNIPHHNRK